jgi:hypothetical protein
MSFYKRKKGVNPMPCSKNVFLTECVTAPRIAARKIVSRVNFKTEQLVKKNPEKVKLSKDGSSIDFVQSDNLPTSTKKFRQSPEIEGFYRFIFENDLRAEGAEILDGIIQRRRDDREEAARSARKAKKQ